MGAQEARISTKVWAVRRLTFAKLAKPANASGQGHVAAGSNVSRISYGERAIAEHRVTRAAQRAEAVVAAWLAALRATRLEARTQAG